MPPRMNRCRWTGVLGVLILLALLLWAAAAPAQAQTVYAEPVRRTAVEAGTEQRETRHADGTVQTRWQLRADGAGGVLRHGPFRRFSPSGRLVFEAFYRDGQPAGVWSWYDAEGSLLKRERQAMDYTDETTDTDTTRDDRTVIRTPGGVVVAEGRLKGDQPHGAWRYYYLSHVLKAEGSYRSGIQEGQWSHYHPNGQIALRAHYALGILHGPSLEAWPSGQNKAQGSYDQGVRSGRWRTWAENGQLLSDGSYVEDREEGLWRYFNADGTPVSRVLYVKGEPVRYFSVPKVRRAQASGIDPAPPPPVLVTEDGARLTSQ